MNESFWIIMNESNLFSVLGDPVDKLAWMTCWTDSQDQHTDSKSSEDLK